MIFVTANDLLVDKVPPGVYRTRSRPGTLQRVTEQRDWRFFHLDGRTVHDKATFLDATAHAMSFPARFGKNWDALLDSMRDLAWAPAPGYVLLYDHTARFAEAQPDAWSVALDVLLDVTTAWQADNVPFYVLLRT